MEIIQSGFTCAMGRRQKSSFAWLAKKRLTGEKIYLKLSTGAKPSLLGEINKN